MASIFGVSAQLLKNEDDKRAVMRALEHSGCPYGSRVHTNLNETHNAILSRHVFYISGRKRSPSWWLVLCVSGDNCLTVLVEPTKKADFPYPRMFLWPGRWNAELYDGSVFVVQGDADTSTLILEDTIMYNGTPIWYNTPFSGRWKVTQQIFYEQFKNDENVNSVSVVLRDYLPLAAFRTIQDAAFIEFVPEDAGRRRFLLASTFVSGAVGAVGAVRTVPSESVKTTGVVRPVQAVRAVRAVQVAHVVPDVVHSDAEPGQTKLTNFVTKKPATVQTDAPTSKVQQPIYGILRDIHPDVYIVCGRGKSNQWVHLKHEDGTPIYAAVQSLATSRALKHAFEAVPADMPLVWRCRWSGTFGKWEPVEHLGGTWNDNVAKVVPAT
jgi:hypothetical protein